MLESFKITRLSMSYILSNSFNILSSLHFIAVVSRFGTGSAGLSGDLASANVSGGGGGGSTGRAGRRESRGGSGDTVMGV